MSSGQPNVPGNVTPQRLLSVDEMTILEEYYRLVSRCKTAEAREKALNGWTARQVRLVSGLIGRLLHNGFVIEGQHESGALEFGVRIKSSLQLIMELSDRDFIDYRAGKLVFDEGRRGFVRVGESDAVQA